MKECRLTCLEDDDTCRAKKRWNVKGSTFAFEAETPLSVPLLFRMDDLVAVERANSKLEELAKLQYVCFVAGRAVPWADASERK